MDGEPADVRDGPAGGRAVVVVGATSGIGLATARLLAAAGDRLVLVARDAGRVAAVAQSLPGPALGRVADLGTGEGLDDALAACVAAYGRMDAVVSTAQTMAYGRVEEIPAEVLASVVDVGVGGTARLARAALPVFRGQGGGHLVVVGSLLAEISVPGMGAYCAAKWGQLALVRALQLETRRERGVHVSLVVPGAVDTPIYQQAATYAGSPGSAPPPVVGPEAVARAVVRCLQRPRRTVQVGPANLVVRAGFRHLAPVYARLVGPLVRRVALRGPAAGPDAGNVLSPRPEREAERGGWTWWGARRGGGRDRWRR